MDYTYEAFISYRHLQPDMKAARAVQQRIETYRFPKDIACSQGRKKFMRCFRDQDELPLSSDLGDSIEDALRHSKYLIVICSPELPMSVWCLKEITYFIELGRRDNIIPVLVSGTPATSFPKELCFREIDGVLEPAEPLAADLTGNTRKKLRLESLRIIARMLGTGYEDLRKRERERKLKRGFALLAAALALVTAFSVYAVRQNQKLTEQRNQTLIRTTQLLIEKSQSATSSNRIYDGISYASQAYSISRGITNEYDGSIISAFGAAMSPVRFAQVGSLDDKNVVMRMPTMSPNGRYFAGMRSWNLFEVYDTLTCRRLFRTEGMVKFTYDNQYCVTCSEDGNTLSFLELPTGRLSAETTLPEGTGLLNGGMYVFASNRIALTDAEGRLCLFDLFEEKTLTVDGAETDHDIFECGTDDSGTRLLISLYGKSLVVDTENAVLLESIDGYASFTDDRRHICFERDGQTVYLSAVTLEEVLVSDKSGTLSPNGKLIAVPNGINGFEVLDAETGALLLENESNYMNTIYSCEFIDDEYLLVSHGLLELYRISDGKEMLGLAAEYPTYGYAMAGELLSVPMRAGGTLLYQLCDDEKAADTDSTDRVYPAAMAKRTENYDGELYSSAACLPLIGTWQYSTYYATVKALGMSGEISGYADDDSITFNADEEGLYYPWQGEMYEIHPVGGFTPFIYVSPDNMWQVMLLDGGDVAVFRAAEGPEAVKVIPGNGFSRLCAAFSGDTVAVGGYVENVALLDLPTGETVGTIPTGEMAAAVEFSADGQHLIALCAVEGTADIADVATLMVTNRITYDFDSAYNSMRVGFTSDGKEAVVIQSDGSAISAEMLTGLDEIAAKAELYN